MHSRRKSSRQKDLTGKYLAGDLDEDRMPAGQRFTDRAKHAQQVRIERTTRERAATGDVAADLDRLPIGEVVQVYSLYSQLESELGPRRFLVRKTLAKLNDLPIVGDRVRFRDTETVDETGRREAVVEQILPRTTLLTRANSFSGGESQPIVANAAQALIVASVAKPRVKWEFIDRMLVAAQSGGLKVIVCLNKTDLAEAGETSPELEHYARIGIRTVRTSVTAGEGIVELAGLLAGTSTVLAGQSGAGKSSLVMAIEPGLDIRIGEVSRHNDKGRHTTTSARRYVLSNGGTIVDTPGIRMFGLWKVSAANLLEYFPDVKDGTAPTWRMESHQHILESIGG